jgi:hypothetical protein
MDDNDKMDDKLVQYCDSLICSVLNSVGGKYRTECSNKLHSVLKNGSVYIGLNYEGIIHGIELFKRLCQMKEEIYQMKEHKDLTFMLISCLIIGYKMEIDDHPLNKHWCNELVGHLDEKSLNECERFVINCLNFNLCISKEEFDSIKREIE